MDANNTEPTKSSEGAPPQAAPSQEDIVKRATEAAKEAVKEASKSITDEALNAIVERLDGSRNKKEVPRLIKEFATSPEEVFEANRELTKRELKAELDAEKRQAQSDAQALRPVLDEFPELAANLDIIELEADRVFQANDKLSREECIKQGAEKAAKRLGLKKLTDEEKERRKRDAMIPASGGGASDSPKDSKPDPIKSARTFMDLRTKAALAPRTKIVA